MLFPKCSTAVCIGRSNKFRDSEDYHISPYGPLPKAATWKERGKEHVKGSHSRLYLKAGPPPLEAILVIFGRRALIFFCLKGLGKK